MLKSVAFMSWNIVTDQNISLEQVRYSDTVSGKLYLQLEWEYP